MYKIYNVYISQQKTTKKKKREGNLQDDRICLRRLLEWGHGGAGYVLKNIS